MHMTLDLTTLMFVITAGFAYAIGTYAERRFGKQLLLRMRDDETGEVEVQARTLEEIDSLLATATRSNDYAKRKQPPSNTDNPRR